MDDLFVSDQFEIEADLYRYDTLNKWLTYEGYSVLIWGGGFFAPVGLIAVLATGAAIVFIPIMIRDLLSVKRFGWIVTWIIMVVVPTSLILVFGPDQNRLMVTSFVFLPSSYMYFWVLKMAVGTWIGQLTGRLELIRARENRSDGERQRLTNS